MVRILLLQIRILLIHYKIFLIYALFAGFAALHYCALHGNIEGVSTLLEAGADVNIRDNRSGRTPFFHALEQNYVSAAQKLLEYGAIANIPNFSGQSILSLVDEAKSISLKAALKQIII